METKQETTERIETIHEALNRIQKELKAPKGQRNSFGNYNYRSCEDILEAVKPLLGNAVLTVSDEIICVEGGVPVVMEVTKETTKGVFTTIKTLVGGSRFYIKATATIRINESNISVSAFARESLDKKGMDDSQITGAASSYARKYALNGLFCIDDTKDPDSTNTHGKEANSPSGEKVTGVTYNKKGIVETVDTSVDPFDLATIN